MLSLAAQDDSPRSIWLVSNQAMAKGPPERISLRNEQLEPTDVKIAYRDHAVSHRMVALFACWIRWSDTVSWSDARAIAAHHLQK